MENRQSWEERERGGETKVESVVEWRQHFSPLRSRYLPTRVTLGHACCAADTWLLGLPRQQSQHHHHRHDIDALKCRFRPKPGQGWADPAPSVKCLCVGVSVLFFFACSRTFFFACALSSPRESCRAVGYFMCVQLSGWSCRLSSPSPSTLPCSDRFRFVSVHISTRLLQLLPGKWGRAALSGLNYVYAALPRSPFTEYLVLLS